MYEIITVKNVRGRFNENGFAEINLEDAARGLGFTETAKSGNVAVRWRTVRKYLSDFGIATCCDASGREGLPEFIAENIFYKLAFRASNETARKFQDFVTDDVLPSIRKNGIYATPNAAAGLLSNPRKLAELLIKFADTQDRLNQSEQHNNRLQIALDESKDLFTVKRVAVLNGVSWKDISWKRLKNTSDYLNYDVKKIFDANYGAVNAYHINVWQREYPEFDYDEEEI